MEFLQAYLDRESVDAFVVGMPKTVTNEDSAIVPQVRSFVAALSAKFPAMAIHLADERFTSSLAKQAQIDGGMKKKQRRDKYNLDKISAAIILQGFLDSGQGS